MSPEMSAAVFLASAISKKRKKRPFRKPKTFLYTFLAQCQEGSDIVCAFSFLSPCILNSHRASLDLGMVSCPYLLSDPFSLVLWFTSSTSLYLVFSCADIQVLL